MGQIIFVWSTNTPLILGRPSHHETLHQVQLLDRAIRPSEYVTNAPCQGFVTLKSAIIDGYWVPTNYWDSEDAYASHFDEKPPHGLACNPDIIIHHGSQMVVKLQYGGMIPEGYQKDTEFLFCFTVRCVEA